MKTIKQSFPNKTKILIKINYDKYLSVDVKQFLVNGEDIRYQRNYKDVLKTLDRDLYDLINFHLESLDNVGKSFSSNAFYYTKKCKDQLGIELYTSEQHHEKLNTLKTQLHNHKVFEKLFKCFGQWAVNHIKEYLNENEDLFKYKDFDKSFDHWDQQFQNKSGWEYKGFSNKPETGTCQTLLKGFFYTLKEYKTLKDKYQYKSLPSRSDLWDCERLSNYLNCDITHVYKLMCSKSESDMKKDLDLLLNELIIEREKRFNELLVKYGII